MSSGKWRPSCLSLYVLSSEAFIVLSWLASYDQEAQKWELFLERFFQSLFKFQFHVIQILIKRSLQNFAHGTTAKLLWYVQIFVAI